MSDKPTLAPATFSPLHRHRVVTLEGPDAARFAHAQFMGDVAQLADRHWQWNGWLTPKGRVLALFTLLRLDATRIWLLLPDADADAFAAQLGRLLFRSKVRVAAADGLEVSGMLRSGVQAEGAAIATGADGALELDMGGDGGGRCLRIGDVAPASAGEPAFAARWLAADLAHGLPRLAADQVGQWTPQQLSLDRLRAFSVRKGCYPGQEIVARTHFLGQAKRGLVRLSADTTLEDGADVVQDGLAIGTVVSSGGDPPQALAVVQLDRADAPVRVGAVDATVHPLLGGLAR